MEIKAPVKLDRKTKKIISKINGGEIAIISHADIDEMAANSLVEKKVLAVINCCKYISGKYPNLGPGILEKAKIKMYEVLQGDLFNILKDGDIISLKNNKILYNDKIVAQVEELTLNKINKLLQIAENNFEIELEKFIDNTLSYAQKEKYFILGKLNISTIQTNMYNKQVLVVVRGQDYREDLNAILSYIKEMKPVLIGVDGGGDALLEFGLTPDIIIGDMDSVSDKCLISCKEIIVHAYSDGMAPGLDRIKKLGLNAVSLPAPGTSEDIAMLLAYDQGADLIVAVGAHSNMIDFLEKGRRGMASTFLVRLKIGSKLVDAKGVNKLYENAFKRKYLFYILMAALIPISITLFISQPFINLLRLILIKFKLSLNY